LPTLDFQEMIPAGWGLCALGRAGRGGGPRPLDGTLMGEAVGTNMELCFPPRWGQRAAVAMLAPLIGASGQSVTTPELLHAAVIDPHTGPGRVVSRRTSPTEREGVRYGARAVRLRLRQTRR
jgi:hypothetical protein